MGWYERDWNRDPERRASLGAWTTLALLLGVLLLLVAVQAHRHGSSRAGLEGEHAVRTHDATLTLLPGLPSITLQKGSLYPKDDPWRGYLADERTCPGGERTDLPLDQELGIMKCLVDYARARRHLEPLAVSALLGETSLAKANRIVRCGDFSHTACGEDAASEVRAAGYYGAWGENLYIAEGPLGAPRVALDGWLNSPGHRENLFQPAWRVQGIAAVKVAQFRDYRDVTLWVNQFGDR
jgi:hypothetical protein